MVLSGGLVREGREVFGLEVVDVGLAAGPCQQLDLHGQRVQEVVDPQRRLFDVEACPQLYVLCGNTHRATTRVAVVALAGRHTDGALVVGHALDVLVAVQRHQCGGADGTRLRTEGEALGYITTVSDSTGHHEVHLVDEAHVLESTSSLGNGRHERDAGLLCGEVRPGSGSTLGAIQEDGVGAALGGHPHVVVDPRGTQLELDRDLVVGCLPDLLDLQGEVVGADPVGVACRGPLVNAGGQGAHLGHLLGDLLAHEVTAQTDLAALADEELDGIGKHEVVRVEAVAALDDLVEPSGGEVPLGRNHAALT
jgi:hypothetical protein